MSEDLVPTLTRAGLAAVRNAQGTGLLATIDRIAVGRGLSSGGALVGYRPTGGETALADEVARVPILQGAQLGGVAGTDPIGFRVLSVVPPLPGGAPVPINEVGIVLSDGTLLAVWSDPALVLAFLTAQASLELAFDLFLTALPVSSLTIVVQRPDVPDTTAVLARLLAASTEHFLAQLTDEWRFPLLPRAGAPVAA